MLGQDPPSVRLPEGSKGAAKESVKETMSVYYKFSVVVGKKFAKGDELMDIN